MDNNDMDQILERLGLTDKQSEAIKMKADGHSQREIAGFLGISLQATQDRLRYGKQKLQTLVRNPIKV